MELDRDEAAPGGGPGGAQGNARWAGAEPDDRPTPPSASFLADRAAEYWSFGEPVRPAESVSGTIDRFKPSDVPADIWEQIEPVVKDSVTKVGFSDPVLARKSLSVVAQLAFWAYRVGRPVDAAALFRPDLIDRFITEGCTRLRPGTRTNYRSQLWQVGAAVVGHKLFPPRPVSLRASDLMEPYAQREITDLVSWCQGLPADAMRRDSLALLAIGLGTGMRSEEVSRTLGTDVREEDGTVLVDVLGTGGRIDRVVPVRHPWGSEVLKVARESATRPYFRPDRTKILRGDILGFIRRCEPDGPPKFCVQRLRVTWIVGHLSAGTHLAALEVAAGAAAVQLVKYLVFAEALSVSESRQAMVGGPGS